MNLINLFILKSDQLNAFGHGESQANYWSKIYRCMIIYKIFYNIFYKFYFVQYLMNSSKVI